MPNVVSQRSDSEKDSPQPHQPQTSIFDTEWPPPDLTPHIARISDQYVTGGAFGDVYRCLYQVGGSAPQEIAVKALRLGCRLDGHIKDKSVRMFYRELGIWRRLSHNNVVPFLGIAYGFGMQGAMSLVSLWMPNESLHKFLATHDDKLDTAHRLQILLDIAKGLDYLHSFRVVDSVPVVHGDLNDNNVLLDADYTARLADFGYASLVGNIPEALTYLQRSTARPGALRWAPPEQVNPKGTFELTTKSDIYSFGCICLQGRPMNTKASDSLTFLQVLSGKQPWSEVPSNVAIMARLMKGKNPGRPESRTMDNSHWKFIQRCWSSLQNRPAADNIIDSIEQFIASNPPSGHLRNLFISSSGQANSLVDESSSPPGQFTVEDSRRDSSTATLPDLLRPMTIAVDNFLKRTKTNDRFRPDPNDFIIVIMGPTGSGKTNFINTLTGNTETRNARNLKSDTNDVTPSILVRNGVRLVLVDTPGFDYTYRSDDEILRVIADWLTQKYSNGETLRAGGIIYLHRITDNRMSGSVYRNLQMFGRLCGNAPLQRARLVTTMWDISRDQAAANWRESELKRDFWQKLLEEGAVAKRFENTYDSAWSIVEDLLGLGNDGEELLLQEELIEQQKHLIETEAAKVLYPQLQRLLVEQRKTLKELADEAKMQNDLALAQSLQEECDKINAQLQKTFEEMKDMKIPLSRRILLWLFGGKSRAQAIKLD